MRFMTVAVAAVLGMSTVVEAATMLTSFENSFNGTRQSYTSYSSTGVSDGSYSLQIAVPAPALDVASGNYTIYAQAFKFGADYRNVLMTAPVKKLAIDVTMPVAPSQSWWWQFQLVLNAQTFGYKGSPTLNANANAIATPTTLVWDYSAMDFSTLPANPTYQEVVFVINAGGGASFVQAPNVYVDNLRLIPEPSVIVGLGLASMGLMLRKRSK